MLRFRIGHNMSEDNDAANKVSQRKRMVIIV